METLEREIEPILKPKKPDFKPESLGVRPEKPEDHIGLACLIAGKFTSMRPIEDSEQFGDAMVGLVYACQKFDPDRGFKFSTFAFHVIRSFVMRGHKLRNKCATRLERQFVDDIGTIEADEDQQRWIDTRDLIATMMEKVSILPPREQAVIRARLEGKKLREISEVLGVTKERVRQIELRATGLLRCLMAQTGAIG